MNRLIQLLVSTLLLLFWESYPASSQGLPVTNPENVGLSPDRLERVDGLIRQAIENNEIAGAVALIARKGKVGYLKAFGMADTEAEIPMNKDTIFRIASMTKPITSVAVMMLYEEGRFLLNDPVSLYLPEFKDLKVFVADSLNTQQPDSYATIAANREMRIRDLLTHTSGLTYHWNKNLGPIYREAGITHGIIQDNSTIGKKMKKLAGLPLLHHPGEKWTYGLSTDVLGSLVEVISGMPFDQFLQTRIFNPLKMKDTHFFLPKDKSDRLATLYHPAETGGIERIPAGPQETDLGSLAISGDYPVKGPRSYFSGGGGLCSTISDYTRFCQMLLNGGALDGVRLLGRKTIELMIVDHVEDLKPGGEGFGLGFSVVRDLGAFGGVASEGMYRWAGLYNTYFWIDPKEELVVLFMAQKFPFGIRVGHKFRVSAYQSIVD